MIDPHRPLGCTPSTDAFGFIRSTWGPIECSGFLAVYPRGSALSNTTESLTTMLPERVTYVLGHFRESGRSDEHGVGPPRGFHAHRFGAMNRINELRTLIDCDLFSWLIRRVKLHSI